MDGQSRSGDSAAGVRVSAAGPARYTKLDVTSGDTLFIGRLPADAPPDLLVIGPAPPPPTPTPTPPPPPPPPALLYMQNFT